MANLAVISAGQLALEETADKECKSRCSVSTAIECIADSLCPHLPAPSNAESCSEGAANRPFDVGNIGFPGPFCGDLTLPSDISDCVDSFTIQASEDLIDIIYGGLVAGGLPEQNCLKGITKQMQKLVSTIQKGTGKCRDSINKGKTIGNPSTCARDNAKLATKITKGENKVRDAVETCGGATIALLDLCGGGIATVGDAQDCLVEAAHEVADTLTPNIERQYTRGVSLIEAAYPPPPLCGDGAINQLPSERSRLGEECDGAADLACPGQCLPPGDVFECTCGNIPRLRNFDDFDLTDSDAGWTGVSHNQGVGGNSGFVLTLSNCDCDAFTDAECTGTSIDPVCDAFGRAMPRCSSAPNGLVRCDSFRTIPDVDIDDEDEDCYVCDSYSSNAGTWCRANQNDCLAQCYDQADIGAGPTGPCSQQSDCGVGEVCLGRCDTTEECLIIEDGGPLPVGSANAAVCQSTVYRDDVIGTRNLVTGAHAYNYRSRSFSHLPDGGLTRPCPVCGGFCVGGDNGVNKEICKGRCVESGDPCLSGEDCPGPGELCSSTTPDCPGGLCQLSLVCGGDDLNSAAVIGKACEIDWEHAAYGTMSSDCPPPPTQAITGNAGFQIDNLPWTTGTRTMPFAVPCSAPGYQNYDCPCPDGGGTPTKPNGCNFACDVTGEGCATSNTAAGIGTVCDIGVNAGELCDEDTDCPGGLCNVNPTHCSGDPSTDGDSCTTNGDCALGTCDDACAGGRCVLLCDPDLGDPGTGTCAAGPPVVHCSGGRFSGRTCDLSAVGAPCNSTCSVSGDPCVMQTDCGPGEGTCQGECPAANNCEAGFDDDTIGDGNDLVGAGICVAEPRGCFLDPIVGTGNPDPNVLDAVNMWCFGATTNAGVNTGAGFGGPGRTLHRGVTVYNGALIP
jgi:hypothetical protein